MKFIKATLFIYLFFSSFFIPVKKKVVVSFSDDSYLVIRGKSNVNRFSCDYNTKYLEERLTLSLEMDHDKILFKDAVLKLQNKGFDCGKKLINKDFHKLLKTEEYPEIIMKIKSVDLTKRELDTFYTKVDFSINNITKEYLIPVVYCKEKNSLRFYSSLEVNIEDFKLTPPKKAFGIVKVRNIISIDFNFLTLLNEV